MKIGSASYAKIGYADFEFTKRNAEVSNFILQKEFALANSYSGENMLAQNVTPRFSLLCGARGELRALHRAAF